MGRETRATRAQRPDQVRVIHRLGQEPCAPLRGPLQLPFLERALGVINEEALRFDNDLVAEVAQLPRHGHGRRAGQESRHIEASVEASRPLGFDLGKPVEKCACQTSGCNRAAYPCSRPPPPQPRSPCGSSSWAIHGRGSERQPRAGRQPWAHHRPPTRRHPRGAQTRSDRFGDGRCVAIDRLIDHNALHVRPFMACRFRVRSRRLPGPRPWCDGRCRLDGGVGRKWNRA